MGKEIEIQKAPNLVGQPQVFFKKNDYDAAIWQQGYSVIIEKAIRCPCKSKGTDNLSNCKNCGSVGWLFINPVQTKAIIYFQDKGTKFKEWSEETSGNANITLRDIDRVSMMDRITILDGESIHTQVCYPQHYKGVIFSFLDYNPKSVSEVFMFNKFDEKLILLDEGTDYDIIESKILLNKKFEKIEDIQLSLRYIHAPQYHIIDVKRDVMVSISFEVGVGKSKQQMPISAIGRRAHYVLDRQNYSSDSILDNSYKKDVCIHDEKCTCKCL